MKTAEQLMIWKLITSQEVRNEWQYESKVVFFTRGFLKLKSGINSQYCGNIFRIILVQYFKIGSKVLRVTQEIPFFWPSKTAFGKNESGLIPLPYGTLEFSYELETELEYYY